MLLLQTEGEDRCQALAQGSKRALTPVVPF